MLVNHSLEQLKINITWNLNRHAGKTELIKKIKNYLEKKESLNRLEKAAKLIFTKDNEGL